MELITISTVTPVYRGAATLRALVLELHRYREELVASGCPARLIESIFVDDGSTDDSSKILEELRQEFPWVHVITLSKNFGQHPATIAGILHTSGDWVATLDEDLQHHPKFLQTLLAHATSDSMDIVYANPESSVHESVFRDYSSRGYKWILSKLVQNKNIRFFNSFRMIRGSIARASASVSIDQTYYDVALSWFTSRIGHKIFPLKDERYIKEGKSGYSFWSLLSHARRLLQSSNVKLLRIGGFVGLLVTTISMLAIIYTVILKFAYPEMLTVEGWASVIISVLFLGGFNALLSGLIIENLSVVLMQSLGKPNFFEVDRRTDALLRAWFTEAKPM
jgi:glycosyltransferase involved in cell wall biosynthesis